MGASKLVLQLPHPLRSSLMTRSTFFSINFLIRYPHLSNGRIKSPDLVLASRTCIPVFLSNNRWMMTTQLKIKEMMKNETAEECWAVSCTFFWVWLAANKFTDNIMASSTMRILAFACTIVRPEAIYTDTASKALLNSSSFIFGVSFARVARICAPQKTFWLWQFFRVFKAANSDCSVFCVMCGPSVSISCVGV